MWRGGGAQNADPPRRHDDSAAVYRRLEEDRSVGAEGSTPPPSSTGWWDAGAREAERSPSQEGQLRQAAPHMLGGGEGAMAAGSPVRYGVETAVPEQEVPWEEWRHAGEKVRPPPEPRHHLKDESDRSAGDWSSPPVQDSRDDSWF
jgi:hypothetical protein